MRVKFFSNSLSYIPETIRGFSLSGFAIIYLVKTSLKNPGTISYVGTILQSGRATNSWAWVDFPYDLKELYGKGNLVPVIVHFDDVVYQGSIAKMNSQQPRLLIRRDILAQLGKSRGDSVTVTVTLDDKPRTVHIPAELQKSLDGNAEAKGLFEKLAYTHRKEYARWIDSAKQQTTRDRRASEAIKMILGKA
jgi:hypothetical protein